MNFDPLLRIWPSATNVSIVLKCDCESWLLIALALACIIRACLADNSTNVAEVAPRLRHSSPKAPVPANNSSTVAPSAKPAKLLKMASRTLSGVGRTPSPLGTLIVAPADVPPMIRISLKNFGPWLSSLQPSGPNWHKIIFFAFDRSYLRGVASSSFFTGT